MTRLVVIGGSDAGIAAALRAREIDPSVDVSVLVADRHPNFSICGLPYLLGGDVTDWRALAHRSSAQLEAMGMQLLLAHEATSVDAAACVATYRDPSGATGTLAYDRLVVATGAQPIRPALPGTDVPGAPVLHTMDHALELEQILADPAVRSAVIVGAGYIGLEMAEALVQRGLRVSVVEQAAEVLPTVDATLGAFVRDTLVGCGVDVYRETTVTALEATGGRVRVEVDSGSPLSAELALVSVGVRPDSALAPRAGVELGVRGAIRVGRDMATTLPHVWRRETAVTPTTASSSAPRTSHSAPPRISRDGSRARTRWRDAAGSRGRWEPRWSRCSIWSQRAPVSVMATRATQASTRSRRTRLSRITRRTTRGQSRSRWR